MPSAAALLLRRSHCCCSSASGLGMSEFLLRRSSNSSNVQPPIPSDPLTSSVMSKFQASLSLPLTPPIQALHAFNSSQPDHINRQKKNEKKGFQYQMKRRETGFLDPGFPVMSDPSSVGEALHRSVLGWARLHSSLSQHNAGTESLAIDPAHSSSFAPSHYPSPH